LTRLKPNWTHRASVDSELCTLFWPPFPLADRVRNPLALQWRGQIANSPRTLMVCRLDGPNQEIVRGMIDQSLEIERRGLTGKVYLDTRGLHGSSAYGQYDEHLRRLGRKLDATETLNVVIDAGGPLFAPGACPEAAIYCGWYSLGRYIDAFDFVPGAVGYHIASSEAATLRRPGSNFWCPRLLADGVVATLGPVEEPYLTAFPPPDQFFGLLLSGRLTLADCYFRTLPNLSWMMTLIGDPLYNPFAVNPALAESSASID
jgi:uncharacterized protein (TIGR03790 family)